ncbi:MAG: hypothetical protein QM817_18485 [Archangium sp.]
MIAVLLSLTLAAPFPLPTVDGKPPAVAKDQKVFKLPIGFARVRSFYTEQLGKTEGVKIVESSKDGRKVLTITTASKTESWTRASVREGEVETTIEVTPVMRLEAEEISGNGKPLVEFVFGRSAEVDKAVNSIDHINDIRK